MGYKKVLLSIIGLVGFAGLCFAGSAINVSASAHTLYPYPAYATDTHIHPK